MFDTYRKILVIAGIIFCLFSFAFAYSGGSGTEIDPYQIATKADLLTLAGTTTDYDKCFILTADIDMEGQVFTTAIIAVDTDNTNNGFDGDAFTGIFNGAGHKIVNLTVNTHGAGNDYLGLFGSIEHGEIGNLGFENISITGGDSSDYLGGLVGYNYEGDVNNCHSRGAVTGGTGGNGSFYLGGLVGYNHGSISNCYSTGAVSGYESVGGLVGHNYYGSISDCYSTGAVTGDSPYYLGGLVGHNGSNGSISNCYSTGNVTGGYWSFEVGGLVGSNKGTISNCHSTGTVTGGDESEYLGGLVGYNNGNISNCYSTGAVTDEYNPECLGGLVGDNDNGNISNCYSTGAVTGGYKSYSLGGLVGRNYGGSISNCYSTGAVTGGEDSYVLGGLVGYTYYGSISNCYSTGAVTSGSGSQCLGGLVGYTYYGSITNCYSTGTVNGNYFAGGLVGYNNGGSISSSYFLITSGPDNGLGTPLTDGQMKQQSSFVGWDFSYTDGDEADWFIQIDEYPILVWQISPADIYTDGRNNFRDFAIFAQYWMRDDCAIYNNYCDRADLNFDGSVDIDDLIELMSYWLESGIYN